MALYDEFKQADTSDFPEFRLCHKILDMGLWVLWVSKDKLGIKRLSADQIASIIIDVKEISVEPKAITQSFNRAGDNIHTYRENGQTTYEIMKPGKDHLLSLKGKGALEVFYFEPKQRYSSKRILATGILNTLDGEVKIVDPYCGERTLDIVKEVKGRPIKFLTRLENIMNVNARDKLLRELQDFKTENADIEFRNYPNTDLHDRYIVAPNCIVILGHSVKDLGSKESFAIVLNEANCKNIYEALSENFDRRWKQSNLL